MDIKILKIANRLFLISTSGWFYSIPLKSICIPYMSSLVLWCSSTLDFSTMSGQRLWGGGCYESGHPWLGCQGVPKVQYTSKSLTKPWFLVDFQKKSGENLWNFQRRTTWTCNSSDVTLGCSCIYVAVYLISLIPNIKCLKLRKKHQKTACLSRGKMISYWIWGYPDLKRTRASCTVAASLW